MPLDIVLLVPRRRFIANRYGLGFQVPLGLVFIGGPLVDAGHRVRLVDNDALGWSDQLLARELARDPPDCVFLGHTGSTAAHPRAMETARALRTHLPEVAVIYGGVYPSYAAESILDENPEIDVVVRGEGEKTAVELAEALAGLRPLASVRGIAWRDGDAVRVNLDRPPIADLDSCRPAWELVDWSRYRLFGFGRSAGMQFSRGCPLRCTFCGQWDFWRRWRHRSPAGFVGQLEILARNYGVRTVWLADENFAADREATRDVLERLLKSDLGLSLNLNMTAADVVRDADIMPLYKRAGVDNIVLGIESLEDGTIDSIRKNNPFQTSRQAVQVLRRHGIVSLVNLIYGLEDESWRTLRRTFRRLLELDPDILNAVYLTPHHWAAAGLSVDPASVIQSSQAFFTYRNQVLRAPRLSPRELFLGVKATEALFHLRPHGLLRLWTGPDGRYRRILRSYLAAGIRVVAAEIGEFLFGTRFSPAGSLNRVPGYPRPPHRKADATGRGESAPPAFPVPERGNRVRDPVG